MITGRCRPVERTFALAAVEAHEMAARTRAPQHAVAVDVAAANAEARLRNVIDFRQLGFRIEAQEAGRAGEGADGEPDRAVFRVRHHRVGPGTGGDTLVLIRIGWRARLGVFV